VWQHIHANNHSLATPVRRQYVPVLRGDVNKGRVMVIGDRLCGVVVRVSGYRYRGPGFDPRRYQIFRVVVGLERGPLSLVRSIEELLE